MTKHFNVGLIVLFVKNNNLNEAFKINVVYQHTDRNP